MLKLQESKALHMNMHITESPRVEGINPNTITVHGATRGGEATATDTEVLEAPFTDLAEAAQPAITGESGDAQAGNWIGHTAPGIDASSIRVPNQTALPPQVKFKSNLEGALWWSQFGLKVMPMVPGQKRPALPHYPWADDVSVDAIRAHWAQHPDHEVGAILEQDQLVLDADTEKALAALVSIEQEYGVSPSLIIKTQRGFHHHFRLAEGVLAKPDSHSTIMFPDRIDVRAHRNSALLTPSRAKAIHRLDVDHRDGLTAVCQDFVDAVFRHNDRPAPRPCPERPERELLPSNTDLTVLSKLLSKLDPDCGYQDWVTAQMAIYHETGGSDAGLELANAWSRKGKSYKGRAEIESKWRSFSADVANPVTIGTLIARAQAAGADVAAIIGDQFQPCETEVIEPKAVTAPVAPTRPNPFQRFSLSGKAEQYRALTQNTVPLLGDVCLFGEATIWYAKHNVGKTLLMLYLLIEAVLKGRIEGLKVFYINADDSSSGLAEKLELLEEVAVQMLAPGQAGFKAGDLEDLMLQAVREGTAKGTLLILDTLKKFADLMNKAQSSRFTSVCRQFGTAGGTILALGHINKRRGEDGKAIHAGTTDFLDDFDAGYLIDDVPQGQDAGTRTVRFERLKSRGGGVESAAYSYASEDGLSYGERLASIQPVNPNDLDCLPPQQAKASEAELISCIEQCITDGVNIKLKLRDAAAAKAKVSKRSVLMLIEQYSGENPAYHRWSFARKARGALTYSLMRVGDEATPEVS